MEQTQKRQEVAKPVHHGYLRLWPLLTAILCQVYLPVPGVSADTTCPPVYWDAPTRACLDPLDQVLIDLNQHWQEADVRINRTCQAWETTSGCMVDLQRRCQGDPDAQNEIRKILMKYKVHSLACYNEELRRRIKLADCFHPYLTPTGQCRYQFDDRFQSHVLDKHYEAACGDVRVLLKCFDDLKMATRDKCGDAAAEEYDRNYIQPVMEPTYGLVSRKCHLSSPYKEYVRNSCSCWSQKNSIVYVLVLLILLHQKIW